MSTIRPAGDTRRMIGTGIVVGALHLGLGAALLATFAGGAMRVIITHPFTAQSWTYVPPRSRPLPPVSHGAAPGHTVAAAPDNPPFVPARPLDLGPAMPFTAAGLPGAHDVGVIPMPPLPQPTPTAPPVPARVLGDPGTWITPDDYPPRALHEGWSGVTRLHLTLDARGRVAACAVTASSGHPELDTVACAKVTERARFSPARDSDGIAREGSYDSAIRWQITDMPVF